MILTLDVGNTNITGGVLKNEEVVLRFRTSTNPSVTSDDLGIFMRSVLRENGFDVDEIRHVALCTVVPDLLYTLKNCVRRYFKQDPFVLQAGVKTGLKIKYRDPVEVGTDRIANAVAAVQMFPQQNLIIMDFGTATTFCAVSFKKEYLGGTIIPGVRIGMESLELKTAKLPKVEIVSADHTLGRSTVESLQSGIYFGQLGAAKEILSRLKAEAFANEKVTVIGTGGFGRLFENERLGTDGKGPRLFDHYLPDLVHRGLCEILKRNI